MSQPNTFMIGMGRYFDLKGLSIYSSLSIRTLRYYIKRHELPHFRLKRKILVKKIEFDGWMERFRAKDGKEIDRIVDEIISGLKK